MFISMASILAKIAFFATEKWDSSLFCVKNVRNIFHSTKYDRFEKDETGLGFVN